MSPPNGAHHSNDPNLHGRETKERPWVKHSVHIALQTAANLVGDIQCIVIGRKSNVGLLLAVRSIDITRDITFTSSSKRDSTAYLTSVFTFATSISYSFLTACLTCGLLALTSTMKTSVLLSSIFFIADSVVKGCLIIAY